MRGETEHTQGWVLSRPLIRPLIRQAGKPLVLGGALFVLTACSSVPDALNPAEWYRDTVDFIAGDDEDEAPETDATVAAADRVEQEASQSSFPNLSRVDDQQRQRNLGLSADPDRPRYAPAITRQGEDTTAIAAAPAAPPAPPTAASSAPLTTPPSAIPSQAPQIAAAPSPATAPAGDVPVAVPGVTQLSIATPADQEAEFERIKNRLKRQLADIQNQSQQQPSFSTGVAAPGLVQPLPTTVVSSGGIEQSSSVFAAAPSGGIIPGAGPVGGVSGFNPALGPLMENNGALPLPAGSQRVATIVFPNGSARLSANDRRILGQVAALQKQRGGTIRVIGHSSSRTQPLTAEQHRRVNLRVSKSRADTVAQALRGAGIPGTSILTAAVSDAQPVFLEVMPTGEAGNRRAEIYLDF